MRNATKLKKELHKLGIKTYRNSKTNGVFVKKNDVVAALKVAAAGPDTFVAANELMAGMAFKDLIVQLQSNEVVESLDNELVRKNFEELLEIHLTDARALLEKHMDDIITEAQ